MTKSLKYGFSPFDVQRSTTLHPPDPSAIARRRVPSPPLMPMALITTSPSAVTAGAEEQRRSSPDAGVSEGRLSKEEAERLLNAMKQDERNLQMWRFQQRKPRKSSDKDW